jgi:hypothetical protein
LSHDPDHTTPAGLACDRFSLIRFRSPLLTESRLFSLPVGTEMFHFPTFPPHALCVQARVTPHDWCGVPPFGNPRINARLTAPRGLSQPPTSFIGSWCPGIHRVPLTTWPHKHPRPPTTNKGPTPANGNQTQTVGGSARISSYMPTKKYRCSRPLCSSQSTESRPTSPTASPGNPGGTTSMRPSRSNNPTPTGGRPVPSGPNSVPTTTNPLPPRSRPQEAVLAATPGHRPNWSAFHPRAPSRTPETHREWWTFTIRARLWTTITKTAASAP